MSEDGILSQPCADGDPARPDGDAEPSAAVKVGDRIAVWFYVTEIGEHDVWLHNRPGRVGMFQATAEAPVTDIAPAADLLAALKLAEDVLSRSPFSSQMWPPNGMHPNTGIEILRSAIAKALDRS